MDRIIIAIDGYSSCGKSTMAKQMANQLNYIYVDTGAMYRAVTFYALCNNLISDTEFKKAELIAALSKINVSFSYNSELNCSETFLNNENIEEQIRGIKVSNYVSKIAQVKEVRAKLIEIQRDLGEKKGLVMDGRDIGSVVFPDAELKIFMTANYKVRAKRRFEELQAKGDQISLEAVTANIVSRDNDDTSRTENPLIQAEDAIVIDNSEISREEQLALALQLATDKIN
ncbi:MAG: (d)CMP kinase [Flavobacteriales bacterium]|tara:strand:+ start:1228 stop:1914 length:687 start_codon:yes stop_codon:yes gene_type:complete